MTTMARGGNWSSKNHFSSSFLTFYLLQLLLLLHVNGVGEAAQASPASGFTTTTTTTTTTTSFGDVSGVEVYRVVVPGMNIFVIGRSVLDHALGKAAVVPPTIGTSVIARPARPVLDDARDDTHANTLTPAAATTTTTTTTAAPTTTTTTTAAPTTITTTTNTTPTTTSTTTTTPPPPHAPAPATKGNTTNTNSGGARRSPNKRVLARLMKQQFDLFKDSLGPPTEPPVPTQKEADPTPSSPQTGERGRSLLVGELTSKAERRAGEDPSGVHSGVLKPDAHPIPVTFTSLPGFPSRQPAAPPPRAPSGITTVPGTSGAVTPLRVETRFNTAAQPAAGRGTPVQVSQVSDLMRLLESRLIGGLHGAGTPGAASPPGRPPHQHFDPSIVVNFLTLVALSQQRSGGFRSSVQRNASPSGGPTITLPTIPAASSDGEFGPYSTGDDPSAGVDPSSIVLPPMLRQSLYSYLLPRLASLSALVETVPGVPGLDYPIIAAVPYTNFYCSEMPWPGFYADTEARCQAWHYCDLDGRQASFLCPNGTMFNQAFFVCDWWYNVDCQSAPYLYFLNERVFAVPEVDETAPHRTLTREILDTIFL